MKVVVAVSLLLAGCSSIFGLDKPMLVDPPEDAATIDDGAIVDVPPDVAPDAAPVDDCPATYNITYMTSRYRVITLDGPWLTSAQDCADDLATGMRHTHLAVVGSSAEHTYLVGQGLVGGWFGLSDLKTENVYRWVTAEPTTYPPATGTPWAQGEPDNALGQDCVASNAQGQWLDTNCGANLPALCECDDYANDPTRYTP